MNENKEAEVEALKPIPRENPRAIRITGIKLTF